MKMMSRLNFGLPLAVPASVSIGHYHYEWCHCLPEMKILSIFAEKFIFRMMWRLALLSVYWRFIRFNLKTSLGFEFLIFIFLIYCLLENLLNVSLTVVDEFHSHLEPMENIPIYSFKDQVHSKKCLLINAFRTFTREKNILLYLLWKVSFGYSRDHNKWNVVKLDGFTLKTDPTRFYSLHCYLFPHLHSCSGHKIIK